ncbi:hypothetical protein ACJX0J_020899 [Zea mays]
MNDGISEEAAKALSELIPATEKLKVLHFHNNMTGDEGAMYIAEMGQLVWSPDLAECLAVMQTMHEHAAEGWSSLNINGNFISDEGVDELLSNHLDISFHDPKCTIDIRVDKDKSHVKITNS